MCENTVQIPSSPTLAKRDTHYGVYCLEEASMNTLTFTSLAAYLLVLFFGAHGLSVEEKETIQRSFSFLDPSGPKELKSIISMAQSR